MLKATLTLLTAGVLATFLMAQTSNSTVCQGFFPGTTIQFGCYDITGKSLYVGRHNEWMGAPDFFMSLEQSGSSPAAILQDGTPKLHTRGLVIADKGDAADIQIRRAGPDNSPYTGSPAPTADHAAVGSIYWQTWGGQVGGTQGWLPLGGGNGRIARIYARACGSQTATSRAGQIIIATAPSGNANDGVDRLNIDCAGNLRYNFPGKGWRRITVDGNGFLKASS